MEREVENDCHEVVYQTEDTAVPREHVSPVLSETKEPVELGGHRDGLGEIEGVLRTHPAIREAAAVARPEVGGDTRLIVYLVYHPSEELSPSEVRRFLRDRLPNRRVPNIVVEMPELPRAPDGTMDAERLPDPFAESTPEEGTAAVPQTSQEQLIAGIWQSLLGVQVVGRHDKFFELGGNSLLVMKAAQRIQNATGHRLEARDMFFLNLEQIARLLPETAVH